MRRRNPAIGRIVAILVIAFGAAIGCAMLPNVTFAASEYDWIKDLLQEKVDSYDPENQTIVVIDYDTVLSEYGEYQNLDMTELGYVTMDYYLTLNGQKPSDRPVYYVLNQANGAVTKRTGSKYFNWPGTGAFTAHSYIDTVTVLLIDNGDQFNIAPIPEDLHWDKGDYILFRPHTDLEHSGYTATAEGGIQSTGFTYEVHQINDTNIEIWSVSSKLRRIDNPGSMDLESYLTLKIELRDREGNISLLKRDTFYAYINHDTPMEMEEDGILSFPITPNGENDNDGSYGEIHVNIPTGYDYRISPISYGEELGQYAHFYDEEYMHDEDGFVLAADNPKHHWSFSELNFLPRDKKLTIKNIHEGTPDSSTEYYYQIYQTITGNTDRWDSEEGKSYGIAFPDYKMELSNYRYRLYDESTGEEIETDVVHKTDENGLLVLKANQYAVFDVYAYPEDIRDYEMWGFNIVDYLDYDIGIETPRPYYSVALDYEQYTKIYNGETVFFDDLASAYPGETITYFIKAGEGSDNNAIDNPATGDSSPLLLVGIFASLAALSIAYCKVSRRR